MQAMDEIRQQKRREDWQIYKDMNLYEVKLKNENEARLRAIEQLKQQKVQAQL